MKRIRFKPSPREQQLGFAAAAEFMASAAPAYKRDSALEHAAETRAAIPPAPKRRKVRVHEALDIDATHNGKRAVPETDIIFEITKMLRAHPHVLFALRINSGAVQRQLADGTLIPMWFYRWIKRPEKMRLPDIFGLLAFKHTCGWWTKPFALEVKKAGWTGPGATDSETHIREREQSEFLAMLRKAGGIGAFVRSSAEAQAALGG